MHDLLLGDGVVGHTFYERKPTFSATYLNLLIKCCPSLFDLSVEKVRNLWQKFLWKNLEKFHPLHRFYLWANIIEKIKQERSSFEVEVGEEEKRKKKHLFCFYFCLCCRNGAGTWNIYKFVRIGPRLCLGSSPVVAFAHWVNLDCLQRACWNLLCLCKVVGIQKLELGKFREVKSRTIAVSKGIKLKTCNITALKITRQPSFLTISNERSNGLNRWICFTNCNRNIFTSRPWFH